LSWFDKVAALEALEDAPLDRALVDEFERARARVVGRDIRFSTPTFKAYATSEIAGNVTVFDTGTRQPLKTLGFSVPGVPQEKIQPVGILVDKERRFAYVALGPANRVAVIDAQKLEILDYVLVGQRVWQMAFSPDQKRLYTANGASNDLTVIDLEKHKALKSIAVGNYPWGVAVRP